MSTSIFLDIVDGPQGWLSDPSDPVFYIALFALLSFIGLVAAGLVLFIRRRRKKQAATSAGENGKMPPHTP